MRPADRTHRHPSAPRSGPAETSQRGGHSDRVDLCADHGRSTTVSPEPRRGLLSGAASWAQKLRQQSTAAAHQQGRRSLPANSDGAGRALYSGAVWIGQRSAALGTKILRARRKQCQETRGSCGRSEVVRAASQAVGERRGVPTIAQPESHRKRSGIKLGWIHRAEPPSSGDCGQVLAQLRTKRPEPRSILRCQHLLKRKRPTGTERTLAHNKVRMEGWRQGRIGSEEDHSTTRGNDKAGLTRTGLLMEGLD